MNKLTRVKIFAISTTSLDDGFPFYSSYWSNRSSAACNIKVNERIVEIDLWIDEHENYYKLDVQDLESVLVDAPSRKEVLAKLTDKEKKVLGLL